MSDGREGKEEEEWGRVENVNGSKKNKRMEGRSQKKETVKGDKEIKKESSVSE